MTQETTRNPMKLAGVAGVVGTALGAVGSSVLQIWRFPSTDATPAEITAFIHTHRPALLAGMVLNTAAVSLWLTFGAGVWLRLREATGGESFLSACFALGLVMFVTLIFAGFTPFFVLAYRAQHASDPRLLYDGAFALLAMSGAPSAVALGSYATLVFRAGQLPRRTADLAAVAAVAHVVLLASFLVPHGFFSLQGAVIMAVPATLFIWIVATGIALIAADRSRRRQRQPAVGRAA